MSESNSQNSADPTPPATGAKHPEVWADPRITTYALGEMSEAEREQFELELHGNDALAKAVEQAKDVTTQLTQLFAQETTPPLDEARRATILSSENQLASSSTGDTGGTAAASTTPIVTAEASRMRLPLLILTTAAGLMLLVGLPFWIGMNKEHLTAMSQQPTGAAVSPPSSTSTAEPLGVDSQVVDGLGRSLKKDSASATDGAELSMVPASGMSRSQPQNASIPSDKEADSPHDDATEPFGLTETSESIAAMPAEPYAEEPLPSADMFSSTPTPSTSAARPTPAPFQPTPGMAPVVSDPEMTKGGMRMKRGGEAILSKQPAVGARASAVNRIFMDAIPTPKLPSQESPYSIPTPDGMGPGRPGDKFDTITENEFKRVADEDISTFSIDVDTASYSKIRDFLVRANTLPRPDMVRIEELVNYFQYDYTAPETESPHPFAADMEITSCPWNPEHRLARIAIQGKTMRPNQRPPCNLVFLLDTSGSMDAPNKLPLVVQSMKMLAGQLDQKDTISIVVYAGSAGLVLDATSAKKNNKINKALTQLSAGGSTDGGSGIQLAYQTAREHFITDGVNRVILCTDGDFNVGTTSTDELVRMVEREAKGGVFLSVLGFGMGNHNDAMLEQISGRGNGNYAFIDTVNEAKKVLVDQTNGTLVTIAKDVKIQVVFNPEKISEYRLIGYENRMLNKEDFNDDRKDAGEIGAGHQVTALYELVPKGVGNDASPEPVDPSPYQTKPLPTEAAKSDEVLTLRLRYKQPDSDTSTKIEFAVKDAGKSFEESDTDVRFAAAVAGFGMKLRNSPLAGSWTLSDVIQTAEESRGEDPFGLRNEFVELARRARQLVVSE
ncbi:VWA domain-containing protein [Stieleria varia]|uniref:von Willebrand factor n=1 Tax=Stieleria varia TaxID=2528005 RepID=A0A5C6BCZ9_9BACT|nr:VWA domain-containing protein [Stieleria varia]TWU08324.1 von Willebrand factor [Stieleria varia]